MKLNFALVGCGRISYKHAEILNGQLKNARLAAVCDIVESKAKSTGQKYNVPFYTDYNEMLDKEKIDVISILTESGNHARHTIDIVKKYKKHIVVEKPMALSLTDADEMIRTCDEYGVKLFVIKQTVITFLS